MSDQLAIKYVEGVILFVVVCIVKK